ncbi:MAG TPA: amino acid permease [Nitrospirales bacterium]|jgi:APA family basic amino acid/polyamine antiporter
MNETRQPSAINAPPWEPGHLMRVLGLSDATMLVVGSMVGSGIFIVSADIARQVGSPGLLLVVWLVTGVMTVIAASYYGELAAAMPHSGGQYVYLRQLFGPLWGFLYGWSMLLIIQTATIAAVAIAFAKFAGVVAPWISSTTWIWKIGSLGPFTLWFGELGPYSVGLNTQNLIAILSIIVLTWINLMGIRLGAVVQNLFTYTKMAALVAVVLLGALFANPVAVRANLEFFWGTSTSGTGSEIQWMTVLTQIGIAMVGSLFAADAWNNVTFVGDEVKNPERTLPRALALGAGIVMLLYFLVNLAYLSVLPLAGSPDATTVMGRGIQYAAEDRVSIAAAEVVFGTTGAILIAVVVMISTFGCNNGLILAGARIYYAMAHDRLFFRSVGAVNRHRVPSIALVIQGVWASLLCLSGTYGQLLDFLIFTVMLFYIMTMIGVFRLRRMRGARMSYHAFGYPVLPIIYLGLAAFVEIQLLRYKPQYTWPGLLIVLLGIPIYFFWKKVGQDRS